LFFFIWPFNCLSVVYSTSLFVILFFFIWPFDCLSVFYLRHVVSLNLS
jgi:hypothetical protein